ncbi:MAG: helix-turn-helix transcriptional regulator [Clostridia bacterium]|nr:helix-turn-helix transcriptional regulator [Clostridia bacterium]
METCIAENIRSYRKQRGLTQEQLAEVLGVSVGAVYKWESRSSLPELRLIIELADFFEVSVDALLGYQMKDNRLNATVERLWKACAARDHDAVSEAEKAVRKYPHSFEAVYAAAFLYYAFASETKKESWIRRAIELLEKARVLVPQCTDPRVNESVLYGRMAEMHELLGETDKALELLKAHNAGAIFNDMIGITLLSHGRDPEEAHGFLEDGFLRAISTLIRTVIGYAMLFDVREDNASGMEMMRWIIPTLEGLKRTDEPDFVDKMIAVFHACLAIFQFKSGDRDGAEDSLRKAKALARSFDAAPNYDAERLKFVRGSQWNSAHDALGKTAMDAVAYVLHDKDPELRKLWAEVCGSED